jgi:hypothetical protein
LGTGRNRGRGLIRTRKKRKFSRHGAQGLSGRTHSGKDGVDGRGAREGPSHGRFKRSPRGVVSLPAPSWRGTWVMSLAIMGGGGWTASGHGSDGLLAMGFGSFGESSGAKKGKKTRRMAYPSHPISGAGALVRLCTCMSPGSVVSVC